MWTPLWEEVHTHLWRTPGTVGEDGLPEQAGHRDPCGAEHRERRQRRRHDREAGFVRVEGSTSCVRVGGSVRVTSRPGTGTTVAVTIPLDNQSIDEESAANT